MRAWLWWRVRLAIGWTLNRAGSRLLDAGWGLINRAIIDHDAEKFQRYERKTF